MRPAYLQVKQVDEQTFSVYWKVPSRGDMVLSIQPVFPAGFELEGSGIGKSVPGFVVYDYRLSGSEPLAGKTIYIQNLPRTKVDVLVNVEYLNGEKATLMLQPDRPEALLPGETRAWDVIKTYTVLGIEHILFGIDHLLFVLALIMITNGFSKLVKTITAFTLAHSITLSLAVLGFVKVPGPPVEAVIALSIVFLAMEIIKNQGGKQTLTGRRPWLVAFTFGLLHGFGFAGALAEVGLPQTEIPLALAFFNVGVELGQLAFVLVALAGIALLSLYKKWPVAVKRIPAYAIGSIAAMWLIERVVGFW